MAPSAPRGGDAVVRDAGADAPATPDGAASEGEGGTDADAPVVLAAPACLPPAPAGPCTSAAASNCKVRTVSGVDGSFPFDIVVVGSTLWWLAQTQMDGGGPAYDGAGSATLHSAPIATTVQSATNVVTNIVGGVALAYDGQDLYYGGGNGSVTSLFRVSPSCVSPCAGVSVADLPNADPIVRIATFGRGKIVFITGPGAVYAVDPGPPSAPFVVGEYPSFSQTADQALVGGLSTDWVTFLDPDGGAASAPVALGRYPDAGGATQLATDCVDVFALRGNGSVTSIRLDGGAQTDFATGLAIVNVYDMKADGTFLYYAEPDVGGLFRAKHTTPQVLELVNRTSPFRITVTSDAIYWGEHRKGSPHGDIYALTK